ncbi:unnamed protein product, partial [Discosporangium mesarthrocarpum]
YHFLSTTYWCNNWDGTSGGGGAGGMGPGPSSFLGGREERLWPVGLLACALSLGVWLRRWQASRGVGRQKKLADYSRVCPRAHMFKPPGSKMTPVAVGLGRHNRGCGGEEGELRNGSRFMSSHGGGGGEEWGGPSLGNGA